MKLSQKEINYISTEFYLRIIKVSKKKTRRDFIVIASYSMGAVGAGAAIWPIINQMNPAADTLAMASTEVNIGALEIGQALTVKWRGKPVFIRRRTEDEINDTRTVAIDTLRDTQSDEDRVQKDEWLVVMGVCTHLGCVPLGQKIGDGKGDYGGWFCPCHGSHYDASGRIRKGPAPQNLEIPPYSFISDNVLKIG